MSENLFYFFVCLYPFFSCACSHRIVFVAILRSYISNHSLLNSRSIVNLIFPLWILHFILIFSLILLFYSFSHWLMSRSILKLQVTCSSPVSLANANPGLNFNVGFFFSSLGKSIFSNNFFYFFRASNHQIVDNKEYT